jgi:zinc D-Ala-D-Ala dipeptidase
MLGMHSAVRGLRALALASALAACGRTRTSEAPVPLAPTAERPVTIATRQLLVVVTPGWDSIGGSLVRLERATAGSTWHEVSSPIPIVVGRTGMAWGTGVADWATLAAAGDPVKHEGDGRAPAGIFRLGTAFGFASADEMHRLRLPYEMLTTHIECVDDVRSARYNTLVDRSIVSAVDWTSAEHMRDVQQYEIGMVIEQNAGPPTPGRGSCVFLHIWAGPTAGTAGCTAMPEDMLRAVLEWLDRRETPLLVQLPRAEYERRRAAWELPALPPRQTP